MTDLVAHLYNFAKTVDSAGQTKRTNAFFFQTTPGNPCVYLCMPFVRVFLRIARLKRFLPFTVARHRENGDGTERG